MPDQWGQPKLQANVRVKLTMRLCLLLWLNFMLYMFVIGGTVKALFTPSTLLLNHVICSAMWVGMLLSLRQTKGDAVKLALVSLLACWYLLTSALSIYPRLSFEVVMQRLMYFGIFTIAWRTAEMKGGARCIAASLLAACAFEVVLSLVQWVSWLPRRPPGEPFERVIIGTLNHPNDLAMFLALALPLWIAMIVEERKQSNGDAQTSKAITLIGVIGTLLTAFCLLLTCSRSGYVSMFALMLSFLALALRWKKKANVSFLHAHHVPIIATSIVILLICISLVPGNWVMRRLIAMFTHIDISVYNRIAMWKYTTLMVADRWLTGYGAGCYPLGYTKFIPQDGVREVFLHPHNLYLHIASEAGIVGLALMGIVLSLCLINGYRHIRNITHSDVSAYKVAAWCACIGFLAGSIGNSEFEIPAIMCAFMALLGICTASAEQGSCKSTTKATWLWHGAKVIMALPIVVLMAFAVRFDIAHFLFSSAMRSGGSEAAKLLRRSIELDPQNAYYLAQLGLLLHRHDLDTAMWMYQRSLHCFDGDPLHMHNLGQLNLLKLKRLINSWSKRLDRLSGDVKDKARQSVDASLMWFLGARWLDPSNEYYRSCVECIAALQMELAGDVRGAAKKLLEEAMKRFEWMPKWAKEHTAALATSLGINLAGIKPKPAARSSQLTTINELRLHLPVRYRRIGAEQEAILVE